MPDAVAEMAQRLAWIEFTLRDPTLLERGGRF